MTTTSYHKSNLGDYGTHLPCDLNGYVHLTADGWLNAPMDWGTEYRDAGPETLREVAEGMAAEACKATEQAEAALSDWQATN